MSMLDDVRFWTQVIRDSRRTIVCSPDLESRVKSHIDARGLDGVFTVVVNEHIPGDTIYVLDENAIAASMAKPVRWRP